MRPRSRGRKTPPQARAAEPRHDRVAIYARFSSDLQSDKSVDDQIAFCRDVCVRGA